METPNRYRYVGANPVNFHDPSGLQTIGEEEPPGEGGVGWGIAITGVQTADGPVDLPMLPGLNFMMTTNGKTLRAAVIVGPTSMLLGESNPNPAVVNTLNEIQNWNYDIIQVNTSSLIPGGLTVFVQPPGTPDELAAVLNGQDRASSIQVTHVPTTSFAPQVNPTTSLFMASVSGDVQASIQTAQQLASPCPNTAQSTQTSTSCDPTIFENWWNTRPLGSAGARNANWYKYEQQVTRDAPGTISGTRARTIPAGSDKIDADGALKSNCRLVEAKYGPTIPPWFDFENEVYRYRLAVTVPNGVAGAQPSGLEFRTNNEKMRLFLLDALQRHGFTIGVDGFVEKMPFKK